MNSDLSFTREQADALDYSFRGINGIVLGRKNTGESPMIGTAHTVYNPRDFTTRYFGVRYFTPPDCKATVQQPNPNGAIFDGVEQTLAPMGDRLILLRPRLEFPDGISSMLIMAKEQNDVSTILDTVDALDTNNQYWRESAEDVFLAFSRDLNIEPSSFTDRPYLSFWDGDPRNS